MSCPMLSCPQQVLYTDLCMHHYFKGVRMLAPS
jgi:hypothetical protein